MNTYNLNNETGKIELKFNKADYMALSQEIKSEIKSAFLWSNYAGGWVSRAKTPNTYRAEAIAKKIGLTYEGAQGEKLSFEQQIERTQEKAQNRAERMTKRVENAEKESTMYWEKSNQHRDFLSLGEPIKIGHHSERRHRKIIEQANNNMRKSVEASKKVEHYENKVLNAEYTASGTQYKNPVYLGNRIKECETTIRKLNKYLNGEGYVNRETGHRMKPDEVKISEERRKQLNSRIAEETEKLSFYNDKLATCGITIYSKKTLTEKKCTHVKYRGTWEPVKSFNSKTVTILNWLGIGRATWNIDYTDIQEIKTIDDMHVVYDRDQNEVKPTVKFKK